MREFTFENKALNIYCYAWDEVESPKGIVQIAHDLGEYCLRYQVLADFLNANGFIVVGSDLRGFGKTCGGYDHRGEVYGDCLNDTVDDLIKLSDYAVSHYRLPLFFLGFGYGALLAQNYMSKHGKALAGCILASAYYTVKFPILIDSIIASTVIGFIEPRTPANFINAIEYKRFSHYFEHEKTKYAYLTRDKEEIKKYVADPFCGAQFVMSYDFQKSYFNNGFWTVFTKRKYKEIPKDLPILIMGGTQDSVASFGRDVNKLYSKLIKNGQKFVYVNLYDKARHDLVNEVNKQEVFTDMYFFLNKCLSAFGK